MKTKKLVTTAMLIALGTILSLVVVFTLPFGGSITAASMVPVVLIGYLYGTGWGVFSAFVYALIQMLIGMGTVSAFFLPGESQMALGAAIMICFIDYIGAFTCLGFSGIFKNKLKNSSVEIVLGAFVACTLRYAMHTISGIIFFGSWAEWFFADSTGLSQIAAFKGFCEYVMNSFSGVGLSTVYSLIYNGAYMIPETLITLIAAPVVLKIFRKTGV